MHAAPSAGDTSAELTAVDMLPILLVDDRDENLRALEGVLAPLGYPLSTASSGGEALRLLLEREFALILLDVRMPGLDGLETAKLIKGRARTRDIPIVFLTAARDEVGDIIRGYGIGAVDYVLKPFDPELLRSKVAVFAELDANRRALKRSEAFLLAAFEAAPIGKTVLDDERRIIRSNLAFARLVGREPTDLQGVPVAELCHAEDIEELSRVLEEAARADPEVTAAGRAAVDLRLRTSAEAEKWVALVASSIEPAGLAEPLLLVQWVDLTARRRAEEARAELLMEQAARSQAEAMAERLEKLEALGGSIESLSLDELLSELAVQLAELFGAEIAEVRITGGLEEPVLVRAEGGNVHRVDEDLETGADRQWEEMALVIERANAGFLRLALPAGRPFSGAERSLLHEAAGRAALAIRRAQLHEQQHRIAIELQRGLVPNTLPAVAGLELAAHYEAAGAGVEVGGDWYDAFTLPGERLGVVLGDVAGSGIPAASAMGQLRSVTRAFALADDATREPADVLIRLNRHQLALGEEELFTVLYAIIDPHEGQIALANAGHPPPLVKRSDGETVYLEGGEGLIGIEEVVYETLLQPIGQRDTVVLYTDGLVERRGESLDAGLERLERAVASGPEDPAALCEHILNRVLPADERLPDDVTAVVVRRS